MTQNIRKQYLACFTNGINVSTLLYKMPNAMMLKVIVPNHARAGNPGDATIIYIEINTPIKYMHIYDKVAFLLLALNLM